MELCGPPRTRGQSLSLPRGQWPACPARPMTPHTVAGQPLVEVDLPGQRHQLLELAVGDAGLGELWVQVCLLLLCCWLLPVGLRFGLPAKRREPSPHVISAGGGSMPNPRDEQGHPSWRSGHWRVSQRCLERLCPTSCRLPTAWQRGTQGHQPVACRHGAKPGTLGSPRHVTPQAYSQPGPCLGPSP